jgi:Amt family ammonium transporter
MFFAVITPLIMTGSYAERITWPAYLILTIGFEVLIYYPVAHWIWGGGWLMAYGVQDFAGGIVVHTTAGAAAVVAAWFVGPRLASTTSELRSASAQMVVASDAPFAQSLMVPTSEERARLENSTPHSLPLTSVGGALLYFGWFGFNAGSAYAAGPLAAAVVSNTQAGAIGSGSVFMLWSMLLHLYHTGRARVSLVSVLNGVIAGLSGITPASGFVSVDYALACGAISGVVALLFEALIKDVLKIDDALDVGAIHGASGASGALLVGIFGSHHVRPHQHIQGRRSFDKERLLKENVRGVFCVVSP